MFGSQIPVLQAPIGGSAVPELVASVANAGAIGGLALTGWSESDASAVIAKTRALTSGLFFVNFLLAFEPQCLGSVLDSDVPIVTFSFGDAGQLIPVIKAAGKVCGVQVGNLLGARRAALQGADFLICQGIEAGGRVQSTQPLESLLKSVVNEDLGVPVVATGGIASGAAIRDAMAMGASGVMMGTRFLATKESRAHELYKDRIVRSSAADTAMTLCFMDGWLNSTHRVLRNQTLEDWEAAGCPPPGSRPGEGDVLVKMDDGEPVARYHMFQPLAGYEGRVEELPMYCGTGCTDIHDVPSAGELVQRLWREARIHQPKPSSA